MSCPNSDAATRALVENLTGPLSVSGDAGSVTQHPIAGIIAANNYLAGICASKTRRLGVRYTHLRPGSTVSGIRTRSPRWDKGYEW